MELVDSRGRHSQNLRNAASKCRGRLVVMSPRVTALSEGNATSIQDMAECGFAARACLLSVGPIDEDCRVSAECW